MRVRVVVASRKLCLLHRCWLSVRVYGFAFGVVFVYFILIFLCRLHFLYRFTINYALDTWFFEVIVFVICGKFYYCVHVCVTDPFLVMLCVVVTLSSHFLAK